MKINTKQYLEQQLNYERCKAENIKLHTDIHKMKNKINIVSKLIRPLQSNLLKIKKSIKQKNYRKSTEKENKSRFNGNKKLSSTKIQRNTGNQSIASTEISSILCVSNTINSSLLTSDLSESHVCIFFLLFITNN